MMHPYLGCFWITDYQHEHTSYGLVMAVSEEEALCLARKQEHDMVLPLNGEHGEPCLTYFDYGDGTTEARLLGVQPLTEKEANLLIRLGIAEYMDKMNSPPPTSTDV